MGIEGQDDEETRGAGPASTTVGEATMACDRAGDTAPASPGGTAPPTAPGSEEAARHVTGGPGAPDPWALFGDRPPLGSSFRSYRLMQKLGEGTFGVVFLAEQERPVRRRVALKVLKPGRHTRQLLGRFEVERQALALMDHPGIAKVYDAGESESGLPFFVMELIDGVPISEHCARERTPIRRRVELMILVCKAIQHAHQKGVIHRDLKPSNVLIAVGDDGPAPKVIDFGIAKALGPSLTPDSDLTQTCQLLGTPSYMSPEQASLGAIDVDARSDIYSLGVMLYELLTGTTPVSRSTAQRVQIEDLIRIIREQEPPRPSAALALGSGAIETLPDLGPDRSALVREIRGDLDWIAMKCLEKDRERRYASANALAMDLQRYLASEPVLAGPPGMGYRLRKFAGRNRTLVAAGALLVLVLAIGAVVGLSLLDAYWKTRRQVRWITDANLVAGLEAEFPGLLTLDYRERHAAMDGWLRRARDALSRREELRAAFERLGRGESTPRTLVASAGGDPRSPLDLLRRLVDDLDRLASPGGRIAEVERRLAMTPSGPEIDRRWDEAISAIAGEPPGIRLGRQEGLYPLGRDPASGRWEFVDLGTGLVPARDAGGGPALDEGTGLVFVLLPGGRVRIGSPPDEPGRKDEGELEHEAELSPLLISKYEVTQAQWVRISGRNPSRFPDPLRPVDSVSWLAAREFCEKAGYRLPTEAEWEYACRGGSRGPYSRDDVPLDELAWYKPNSGDTTHPVGRKLPNPFGLFDVHGNVLEWCQDVYEPGFYRRPEASLPDPRNDPPEASETEPRDRVLRGGPFDGQARYCRCADRWWEPPNATLRNHGIRPVRPIR